MKQCDVEAIERLILDHFAAVDDGDLERQADFFANGRVRYVHGDQVLMETTDRASFLGAISTARRYDDGTPRTHHIISNIRIDVRGATAQARFYSTVLQATDELPLQVIACGQFEDELAKDDDGWYFVDRVGRLRLVGAAHHHVPTSSPIGSRLDASING